ncbi:unnamed protein product [Bursaphelenchus okinawaensis]|uniref:Uncharacterized protein n=1 Tax=Bursaphelenchus okinawaensis TaxID=465554 RepID=A0A811JUN3_9BILA|nr:unnamed protein product [Bursaphelenchus okinawaensis]CAG9084075.1 unnamed protein product [Bursaphelenchus okinawaensis]
MSCSLKEIFRFTQEQINQVDRFLNEDLGATTSTSSSQKENSDDDEIDDNNDKWPAWEPESSELSESDAKSSSVDTKWLRNCIISSSANMELIVFAAVQRFVAFERNGKDEKIRPLAWVNVNMQIQKHAYITSVEVISLASTRKTEASNVDWHCIAVSTSSGYVHFFTDRGVEILCEKFSSYKIQRLRFGPTIYDGGQGLAALAMGRIYIVEGMALFHGLRNARNEVARGIKSFEEICNTISLASHAVKLDYLKQPTDFQLLNITRPESFDQYFKASLDDYSERNKLQTGAKNMMNYFCATRSSYAAFLSHNKESNNSGILQEAYNTIASQIQMPSFGIRSFLGIGVSRKDGPQKESVADAKVSDAFLDVRLVDPGRKCETTVIAPRSWNLMAISDGTARVLLMDTRNRTVVRIWKGYRNAGCGFIEAALSDVGPNKRKRTKTLFLVIFAPKRGILEVWSMQNGPRVAAFNVDPKGRLLSVASAKDSVLLGPSEKQFYGAYNDNTVVFVNSNGMVQRILIPFHLSAMDSTVSQVHDENMLRDFKHNEIEEDGAFSIDKALGTVESLKSSQSRMKFVDRLVSSAESWRISTMQLREFLVRLKEADKGLKSYIDALIRLVDVYNIANKEVDEDREKRATYETLVQNLGTTVDEYNDFFINVLLDTQKDVEQYEACSFKEFREMLRVNNAAENKWILNPEADEIYLARVLMQKLLFSHRDDVVGKLEVIADKININIETLAKLFMKAWLADWNKNPWVLLDSAISVVSYLKESSDIRVKQFAQSFIIKSQNPEAALCLMFVIRYVDGLVRITTDDNEEFENMDETTDSWYLTVKNLIANTLISRLDLELKPSLDKFTVKGYGYYREQIGQWAASNNVPVDLLLKTLQIDKKVKAHRDSESDEENKAEEEENIDENKEEEMDGIEDIDEEAKILKALQQVFQRSFSRDLCLCDCVWESASSWFKEENQRQISTLTQAMTYLSAITSSARLQHGLSVILWETFFRLPFQKLYTIIMESNGKPLKERLLKRDVFVTESELPEFVKCVKTLLNVLQKSVVDLEYAPHLHLEYEEFLEEYLESFKVKKNRKHTLAELVSGQTPVNYHLVLHHLHLVIVIDLQLSLNLSLNLYNVFDGIMHRAFFESFHSHPLIPMADTDERFKEKRQKFLEDIVVAIGVDTSEDYYEKWELVNQLCREWALDLDLLRIKEVKMFYEFGFDREAEKLRVSVAKQKQLSFELIPIALGRFKSLIDSDEELRQKAQRRLRPGSWEYIRVLSDEFIPTFSITVDKAYTMMRTVSNLLNHNISTKQNQHVMEKKMISDICDFLQSLK